MDVVFYDPHRPDGTEKAVGLRRAETLDELLAQSPGRSRPSRRS